MSFVLVLINVIFIIILIRVRDLALPIEKMMNNVNNLMDSENYLLETYFDFKAKYIIEENFTVDSTFFDSLLSSQQSSQVLFNEIAVQSLDLFSNYDESYTQDFIQLLVENVC